MPLGTVCWILGASLEGANVTRRKEDAAGLPLPNGFIVDITGSEPQGTLPGVLKGRMGYLVGTLVW